jgi:hypothetical protein
MPISDTQMQLYDMETELLRSGGVECRAMPHSLVPIGELQWSAPDEIACARAAQGVPKFLLT